MKKADAVYGEGEKSKSLREAYVCDELRSRPRVCRYQLGRLRRLLIKTGAEKISWALGAAFLKGPSTRKDGADMWRSRNALSLAPSCGHSLH